MNATHAPSPEVDDYVAAVRVELADLPEAERDDILSDVEVSVAETAREHGGSIASQLGPPPDFAAELRAAAGLEPPRRADARAGHRAWRDSLHARLAHPRVITARRLGGELAPLWWVVRGYLAVAAVALATDVAWTGVPPLVPRFADRTNVGLAVIAVAVAASIAVGLLARRGRVPVALTVVVNAVLLACAVPVLAHADETDNPASVVFVSFPAQELTYRGSRVENLYPYSRDGRLLQDVLLYGAAGEAIEIGSGSTDPLRRVLVGSNGERLFNSFPIRYFEPNARVVAHPNAGPPVEPPRIETPRIAGQRTRPSRRAARDERAAAEGRRQSK